MVYCKICQKEVDESPEKHWEKHSWLEVFGKPIGKTKHNS